MSSSRFRLSFVWLLLTLQLLDRYLRRTLIPRHPDLRFAGLLNPLDTPHHMRITEVARFREGVVVKRPCKSGAFVNVGLKKVSTQLLRAASRGSLTNGLCGAA